MDVGGDAAELGPQLWLAQRLLARAVAAADAWVAGEARAALGPPPAPDAAECAGGCPRLREPGAALSAQLGPSSFGGMSRGSSLTSPHLSSELIPLFCNLQQGSNLKQRQPAGQATLRRTTSTRPDMCLVARLSEGTPAAAAALEAALRPLLAAGVPAALLELARLLARLRARGAAVVRRACARLAAWQSYSQRTSDQRQRLCLAIFATLRISGVGRS